LEKKEKEGGGSLKKCWAVFGVPARKKKTCQIWGKKKHPPERRPWRQKSDKKPYNKKAGGIQDAFLGSTQKGGTLGQGERKAQEQKVKKGESLAIRRGKLSQREGASAVKRDWEARKA